MGEHFMRIKVKELMDGRGYVRDKNGIEEVIRENITMVEYFRIRTEM